MNAVIDDIRRVAEDAELYRSVEEVYSEVARRIEQLDVSCRQCGQCCRFAQFGQKLLAGTVELGYMLAWLNEQPKRIKRMLIERADAAEQVCPFLEKNTCLARAGRALGCRVFFCQAEQFERAAMERIYEDHHRQFKKLHEERGLAYKYVPWEEGLWGQL